MSTGAHSPRGPTPGDPPAGHSGSASGYQPRGGGAGGLVGGGAGGQGGAEDAGGAGGAGAHGGDDTGLGLSRPAAGCLPGDAGPGGAGSAAGGGAGGSRAAGDRAAVSRAAGSRAAAGGGAAGGGAAQDRQARDLAAELGGFVLARGEVDRASARREDAGWIAAAWADDTTRVLVLDKGQALVRFGEGAAELVLVPPAQAPDGVRFLLGVDAGGIAYFGVAGPAGVLGAGPAPPPGAGLALPESGEQPAALRQAAHLLGDRDAGLFTHAVALANWHARHTHCPRCGTPTVPAPAGHARHCPTDGSEHFPRIDPAVIMLVTDEQDRCLLARNRRWPARRFNTSSGRRTGAVVLWEPCP